MFRKSFFGIISVIFLMFNFTAFGQATFGQPGLGLGIAGGAITIDPDVDKEDMVDLKLRAYMQYDISGPFRGELSGAYGQLRHAEGFESNVYPIENRVLLAPLSGAIIGPYAYGGVGAIYFSERTHTGRGSSGWSGFVPVGAGLQIRFAENFAFDMSGGYNHLISNNFDALNNNDKNGYWGASGGLTFLMANGPVDSDEDGLLNNEEKEIGTDPENKDSDSDGLNDYAEFHDYETDPLNYDTDGDGIGDAKEVKVYKTNPRLADTDNDGLNDSEEIDEYSTNPNMKDTDEDGLNDKDEIRQYKTDATIMDTDNDGIKDGEEVSSLNTDPLKADTDDDGLKDGAEVKEYKTDPTRMDTDKGTVSDGEEVNRGTDPLNSNDDVEKSKLLGAGIGVPVVLEGVFFDLNKATIRPESEEFLNGVAKTLKENPDTEIEIHGHTDNTGSDEYNMILSQRRADAVKGYLVRQGVNPSRITTMGYGEESPIATNATPEGRQKNRRIEFVRVK